MVSAPQLDQRRARIIVPTSVDFVKQVTRDRQGNYRTATTCKKREHLKAKGVPMPAQATDRQVNTAIERIIDGDDLKPISWLTKARTAAAAVGLISMEVDGKEASATGFMISPCLMMTNHHVLHTAEEASDPSVNFTFGHEKSSDNRPLVGEETISLDAAAFFVSSEELDYTIVGVGRTTDRQLPGDKYGRLPLIKASSKALPGSALNIIQHPGGNYKQIAFRNNLMTDAETPNLLVYLADTTPGSSGSPVLDDDFDLVALHHGSRDFTDDHGNKIDLNGDPVTAETPEALRYWVANEGIRISAIVADLARRQMSPQQRALISAAIL
ncbi:trypsin-like serine peptidase [Mycolicibacterium aichiense]|uniref:Serine protease n=1 Tax=Mycolicibacterium aichiense TaxID=1799 RepID=A0AAD1MCK1_9MYCO|nr:serine protease [Mycolicibacterium aichiense]MCV7018595.1 trypsin-like peptidase domain-containing protein [Mycolicibacterium aichiense]BBX07354.1 hypothetical protein MAIC_21570 [Mycolicibacterium aichiense]STZ81168.1 V8-like Glu-specific endopeptidase [Mycolicibacterium aichiense]